MSYVGRGQFGDILYTATAEQKLRFQQIDAFPVRGLQDLPAPVGGVISLPDDTAWQILGTVDISPNRIEMGSGTSLVGTIPSVSVLVSNQADPAVSETAAVGNRFIENLAISNNAGGAMRFIDSVTLTLYVDTVVAVNVAGIALETNNLQGLLLRSLFIQDTNQGIVCSGTNGSLRIEDITAFQNPGGFVGVTLSPGLAALEVRIESCSILLDDAADIGLQLDAGAVDRGLVTSNQFPGGVGTALQGTTTPATTRWLFTGNQGIRDSSVIGDLRFVDTAGGPTDVPVTGTGEWSDTDPELTYTLVSSERMSQPSNDVLQYDGIDPINLELTAVCTLEHEGGGNDRLSITVQRIVGGVGVPATGSTATDIYQQTGEVNAGEANTFTTTFTLLDVQPGTQFRILFKNDTAAVDGEFFTAALTIRQA